MNRAERIERVLRRMAAERVDTLIAFSNAKHHLARINLAAHLMGYRASARARSSLRADGTAAADHRARPTMPSARRSGAPSCR